jgi:hypothetical protein
MQKGEKCGKRQIKINIKKQRKRNKERKCQKDILICERNRPKEI